MTEAVFSEFLKDKDEETVKKFLDALTEDELHDFCSSQEEYCVLMGRDPKATMRKQPVRQQDVETSMVDLDRIKERYEKFVNSFPEKPTLQSLKDHIQEKDRPAVSVTINLGQVRQMAGQEKPNAK